MYALFRDAGTLETWKMRFCAGKFEERARYTRTKLGHPVPVNLLPTGTLLKHSGGESK